MHTHSRGNSTRQFFFGSGGELCIICRVQGNALLMLIPRGGVLAGIHIDWCITVDCSTQQDLMLQLESTKLPFDTPDQVGGGGGGGGHYYFVLFFSIGSIYW